MRRGLEDTEGFPGVVFSTGSVELKSRHEERIAGESGDEMLPASEGEDGMRDPLEKIKRRAYVTALLFALPAVALLWTRIGSAEAFASFLFPALGVFFAGAIWALLSGRVELRKIELAIFFFTAVFFIGQLAYALFSASSLSQAQAGITENVYTTFTALYVAACLIFDTRTGLRASVTLFGIGLVLVLARVALEGPASLSAEEASWVLRMHAYMAAVIALLYTTAYAKSQLARERALSEAMSRMAFTDQLTRIPNRRKLYMDLQREMERSRRYDHPLSVILFDLDHFKRVNDTHGHDHGDEVLKAVARVVEPVLRATDHFGRWGGEEFIVVTPETDLEQASYLAERLQSAIAGEKVPPASGVTASFGLSRQQPEDTLETLIKRTDEALYDAKAKGRNRLEVRGERRFLR